MSLALFQLTGRTAWITGGSKGLGLQMAQALAGMGANIVVNSRNEAEAEAAARAIAEKHGVRTLGLAADVTNEAEIAAVVQRATADFGGIDILVNNAGVNVRLPTTEIPVADWQRVLDINLTGAMLAIRALAPLMARGGAIVNIASTVAMTGYYNAAYCASKWALRGLTKSAALELASRGVRVNCVCPGVVDTEMIHNSPALVAALQHVIPMQHRAAPEQIAEVVAFLLGPHASYVTGADVAVDGGVTGGGLYWPVGLATGALHASEDPLTTAAITAQ